MVDARMKCCCHTSRECCAGPREGGRCSRRDLLHLHGQLVATTLGIPGDDGAAPSRDDIAVARRTLARVRVSIDRVDAADMLWSRWRQRLDHHVDLVRLSRKLPPVLRKRRPAVRRWLRWAEREIARDLAAALRALRRAGVQHSVVRSFRQMYAR